MDWQYKVIFNREIVGTSSFENKLNELDEKGWELTTMRGDYMIFKREIKHKRIFAP